MKQEEEQKDLTGRRAVTEYFIRPLVDDGLQRPRKVKVEDHEAMLDKVKTRLAYCDADTLVHLRSMILGMADGPKANIWPSYATIRNLAHTLQSPPDTSDKTLYGWLHSRAGVVDRRNGVLLALREYIKKNNKPPVHEGRRSKYAMRQIEEAQRVLDLDMDERRRRIAEGVATPSEIAWLEEQEATLAGLVAVVDAGVAHREAKERVELEDC